MKKKEIKKQLSPEEKKKTITAFLLTFPGVIIGFIAIASLAAKLWVNVVIIALLIMQFVLIEQFVKDYYRERFYSKQQ